MTPSPFSVTRFHKSLRHALRGVGRLFASEPNARVHLLFCILVPVAGWLLKVSTLEWIALLICIGSVLAAEAFNTALEALADRISTEYSPLIRDAKDLSAGAVLILAIMSATVGLIIFLPKLGALLGTSGMS